MSYSATRLKRFCGMTILLQRYITASFKPKVEAVKPKPNFFFRKASMASLVFGSMWVGLVGNQGMDSNLGLRMTALNWLRMDY